MNAVPEMQFAVAPAVVARVQEELRALEAERGLRVLYACESGSRAWGFASTDSDFDVRFLYVHPPDWYLSVQQRRDVVEAMLPGDLDLAGWDLRKTLCLLRKSNPALLEWLRSPVVYQGAPGFLTEFRALAESWYSPRRVYTHYLHMAWGNWRRYLQGAAVSHKRYLYVLRPVLACRWVQLGLGQPPMEFDLLREPLLAAQPGVAAAVESLLERKMAGVELATGAPDPVLHAFLERELADLEAHLMPRGAEPAERSAPADYAEMDAFFRRWSRAATLPG